MCKALGWIPSMEKKKSFEGYVEVFVCSFDGTGV
jgi:hypothetical protein